MMATFHRMKDETGKDVVRAFVKGAPDQLLARGAFVADAGPRRRPTRRRRHAGSGTSPRTSASDAKGLRVMATGRKDFDPATFDPTPTSCRSSTA